MKKLLDSHKQYWGEKQFISSILVGILFFAGSLAFNHYTYNYAIREASNSLNDLILDHLPVFNVDFILNEGVMIAIGLLVLALILEPKRLPFVLKSMALFIIIRAIFITLTHFGPPIDRGNLNPEDMMYTLSAGSDFFFSGHTGMPFLLALIFWDNKIVRYVGFAITAIFGSAVILGHFHYSIDVLAAFFISYTILQLSKVFFANDFKRMKK